MSANMSVPSSYVSLTSESSEHMAIYRFVTNYSHISDEEFLEKLYVASCRKNILNSSDFLEFLAWWFSRDDFRNNAYLNSSFGVVQRFRGLLSNQEDEYVGIRYNPRWFNGVPLKTFLLQIVKRFYPRQPGALTILAPTGRQFVVPVPLDGRVGTLRIASSFALFNHREGLEDPNADDTSFWRPGLVFNEQLLNDDNALLRYYNVFAGALLEAVALPQEIDEEHEYEDDPSNVA